jgi:hypothetical protein
VLGDVARFCSGALKCAIADGPALRDHRHKGW